MRTNLAILKTILDKFPERANVIDKFYKRDENFREICEDYFLCKQVINKIIITDTQKRKIIKDYKYALKELELLVYMNSNLTVNDN